MGSNPLLACWCFHAPIYPLQPRKGLLIGWLVGLGMTALQTLRFVRRGAPEPELDGPLLLYNCVLGVGVT